MGERTYAPYNFVPFSTKVLERYQSEVDLPPHDIWDENLKSGEIHVTLQAQTPVLVSDGRERSEARFCKGPDGRYQIPGSTVRGLLRQTMQILGFGHIRAGEDLEDYQIFFRDVASKRSSVGGALREYYHRVLGLKALRLKKKTITVPQAVCSGYLHCKGGAYYIQPTVSEVLRVPREHPDVQTFGQVDARTYAVSYRDNGKIVTELSPNTETYEKQGVLLYTGKPIRKKTGEVNCLYLFPEEDTEALPIPIAPEDVLSYRVDWENRQNVLKPKSFWALPNEGESKAVFYLRYEGHTYFGMSRMLRVGYRHPLSHGLPKGYQNLSDRKEVVLDYPHAVMGYATQNSAYRSRVSVGDFPLVGTAQVKPGEKTVLGSPKASFYAGYTIGGKDYNDDDMQLRGHKFYWHKQEAKVTPPPNENESVSTTLYPLDKGSTFQGVIRYRNLHPDELGLLLWCIRLEPGCFHGLGMGKPYGYGRMKATIDRLIEWDIPSLYTWDNLTGQGREPANLEDAVETYIRTYDNYATQALELNAGKKKEKKSVRTWGTIQDFFFLRSALRDGAEVDYMPLKAFQNLADILTDVRTMRLQAQEDVRQVQEPEDLLKALQNRYRGLKNKKNRRKQG